jgi:hypothetical protein
MIKTCNVCNQSKSIDEFYIMRDSKDGHDYRCKTCSKKSRKYYSTRKSKKSLSECIAINILQRLSIPHLKTRIGGLHKKPDLLCYGCVFVEVKLSNKNKRGGHLFTMTKAQQNKGYADLYVLIAREDDGTKRYFVVPEIFMHERRGGLNVVIDSNYGNSRTGKKLKKYQNAFHLIRDEAEKKMASSRDIAKECGVTP